ncbi:MAG: glycosyltransferase [Phormidesmis sp.]
MTITAPKISVLMSVYNGSLYLRESIESVLNQTFTNFEFIIIDDCSTDDSWEILKRFSTQDSRIVLLKNEENIGLTKSLNKGLRIAKGEYVARQDADDISLPTRFDQQVAYLEESKDVVLVSANYSYIDAEGSFINSLSLSDEADITGWYLLFYNRIGAHGLAMFRREEAIALGGYLETFRYSQDYEFWHRLRKVGKLKILPDILQLYRRSHSSSISVQAKPEQEALSVIASQQAIEELTSKKLSTAEITDLKHFWLGRFAEIGSARSVGSNLSLIFSSFIKELGGKPAAAALSIKIKNLIIAQFEAWIENLGFRRGFVRRLNVTSMALFWAPIRMIRLWQKDIFNRTFENYAIGHQLPKS